MKTEIKNAIETYQCPGCVCGSDISCFKKGDFLECGRHVTGTTIFPTGRIFLGMPTGFNRLDMEGNLKIKIFENPVEDWEYDKYNIPVWKYLDEHGNTIVRGLSPRINFPFLHIFIGNHMKDINCLEITDSDIDFMD